MRAAKIVVSIVLLILIGASATRAAPFASPGELPEAVVAPRGVTPALVHHAGPMAVMSYRAALEHPGWLAAAPCTCGCMESLGHRHNLDCYIVDSHPDGTVTYSTHGLYCGVCQLITRDVVAGARSGMSMSQLNDLIVSRYGS